MPVTLIQAGPVVRPLLNVERRWIVLGHIGLADTADLSLPRHSGLGGEQGSG